MLDCTGFITSFSELEKAGENGEILNYKFELTRLLGFMIRTGWPEGEVYL